MTNICIFTSTRADYGILSPLVRALIADGTFNVRLFVTGTHLLENYGNTLKEIQADGFQPYYTVPLKMNDDKNIFHLEAMSDGLRLYSEALSADLPDVAVVLGDRFEALAFAIASNGLGVPIVHLHGGEITEGALDDGYRHCITKLSFLHFVATQKYADRVIRMGESPDCVHNVGALGIDNIKSVNLLSRPDLDNFLGVSLREKVIAVTYHPETSNSDRDVDQITSLLEALGEILADHKTSIVFSGANADHGSSVIQKLVESFVVANSTSTFFVSSLGIRRYLSLMKIADVVVGNSSSGIIEAPALGTPTVNVGDRQKGREMAESIFNVPGDKARILEALNKAIKYKFDRGAKVSGLYGNGDTAEKMVNILKKQRFTKYPKKSFYDGR